jgi:hypothetical protein
MLHLPLILETYNPCELYFDDFSDTGSGWPSRDDQEVRAGYANGEYQILVKAPDGNLLATPDLVLPADYVVEVDARRVSANPATIVLAFGLRLTETSYEVYQFGIDPSTRQYFLEKRDVSGQWTLLINWTTSSAIRQGTQSNHLQAIRQGTSISLHINGTKVRTLQDASFTSAGRDAGVRVYSQGDAPVEARFDNFRVTCIGGAPSPTATPTARPSATPTPTKTASPPAGCPRVGAWSGEESQQGYYVTFEVTADCRVHDLRFKIPFLNSTCTMSAKVDLDIVGGQFELEWGSPIGIKSRFTGAFDSATHASGSYGVSYCDGTLVTTPSTGTWTADWSGPSTSGGGS